MYPLEAPLIVLLGIPAIAGVLVFFWILGGRYAARRAGLAADLQWSFQARVGLLLAAWLFLCAVLSLSGLAARFDLRPPPFIFLLFVILLATAWFALSATGAVYAKGLPFWVLIGFQSFRLPLELVMHQAAASGVMPVQMSFSGANFDVVSGASAIVVAMLAWRGRASRRMIVCWNMLGLALLTNIVAIAVASTPYFMAFGEDRQNTWVAYFPFIYLPAVMVASALCGHILLFRKLASESVSGR